jgi:hypothetical protein
MPYILKEGILYKLGLDGVLHYILKERILYKLGLDGVLH